MKKLISLFLILFISVYCVLPSFAAKSVKFSASDGEVFAGDEFTVDIFISDYSLLKSATFLIEYDKNALQFLDMNVGPIVTAGSKAVSFNDVKNSDKSYIQIDYKDSSASLSSAGKFLSLTFVANDTAVGETDIKLSVKGNKIAVSSGSLVPEFKNGKIKIINNAPVTESKTEPSTEQSSTAPISSENAEDPSNSVNSPSQSVSQNTGGTAASGKNEDKSKTGFAFVAVAVAAVVICALFFGSSGNGKKRTSKKKKRKKRK